MEINYAKKEKKYELFLFKNNKKILSQGNGGACRRSEFSSDSDDNVEGKRYSRLRTEEDGEQEQERHSKMRVDVDVRSIRVIPKSVLKIGVKLPEMVTQATAAAAATATSKKDSAAEKSTGITRR